MIRTIPPGPKVSGIEGFTVCVYISAVVPLLLEYVCTRVMDLPTSNTTTDYYGHKSHAYRTHTHKYTENSW